MLSNGEQHGLSTQAAAAVPAQSKKELESSFANLHFALYWDQKVSQSSSVPATVCAAGADWLSFC